MTSDTLPATLLKTLSLLAWFLVVLLPLLALLVDAVFAAPTSDVTRPVMASLSRSVALAALIAAVAVLLGWLPGRLLGTARTGGVLLLVLLLLPLVLPRYVLYYAWTLLLSPTTALGTALASRPELARFVGTFTSTGVLVGWYWPVAALVLAQGWRGIDGRVWEHAKLEAGPFQVFRHITLPLLLRPLGLAFAVCFVLTLSEFATFHLAGVETVGTELAVLYELTGATAPVARAAWPVAVLALAAALLLTRASHRWVSTGDARYCVSTGKAGWIVLVLLLAVSVVAPILLMVGNVASLEPFRRFLTLHLDELGWSLATAVLAATLAYLVALSGLFGHPGRAGRVGSQPTRFLIAATLFLAMFLPASLVAVSVLKLLAVSGAPAALRQAWWVVSMGQAARFAGLAFVLLLLTRYPDRQGLTEMASLDGASPARAWWHVHLPQVWPVQVGTFLLVMMFSFTELSATMVLLPAGLPNFAQRLLNQMHYARDQQVIASCLVLVGMFVALAVVAALLLRRGAAQRSIGVLLLSLIVLVAPGCGQAGDRDGEPEVVGAFGKTGAGEGEFLYPRAIDLASDGTLYVVDKTGRIQHLTNTGAFLGVVQMPLTQAGKPTGISLHPDGRLFVADTHYHRVIVYSPSGEKAGEFGQYGKTDGCFIFPTDVTFSQDGRLFVGEYGGNDRISVFTKDGAFLMSFGSPGTEMGQFSRPAALCIDETRKRLYVADACNHRIAVYDLDAQLIGYFGEPGVGLGQLRYPYDLALLDDGTIVVCEFGNNRTQLFSPGGVSLATYGRAGRELGQLAYPWGVAVDAKRRAYVVDAGNNRIQVWQL
ncbi:MAG: SMP-30/gluconolactonase/LRE family protein [Sedimentisphaerales bacterium]|nr:SMP-30/gluconolactonase/LRE family protein [Sedimentisphaerales bacterium]